MAKNIKTTKYGKEKAEFLDKEFGKGNWEYIYFISQDNYDAYYMIKVDDKRYTLQWDKCNNNMYVM